MLLSEYTDNSDGVLNHGSGIKGVFWASYQGLKGIIQILSQNLSVCQSGQTITKQDIKMSNFTHILVTYKKEILKHNSNPSTKKT